MKTFIFLVLLVAVPAAWAIKCYTCTDCKDDGTETDCIKGFDMCLKVYAESGGNKGTSRSCANKVSCDAAKAACKLLTDAGKECESPCCDSDLCNAGAAPTFSVLLVSLCSLFAMVPLLK